jgi:quinol monooxygenase YgiN
VVIRAETRPGLDEEFEALLQDLALRVADAEPECTSYVATRMIGSHSHFAVHARFSAWGAFERHADTEHLTRLLPQMAALLAAPISMEMFFEV